MYASFFSQRLFGATPISHKSQGIKLKLSEVKRNASLWIKIPFSMIIKGGTSHHAFLTSSPCNKEGGKPQNNVQM